MTVTRKDDVSHLGKLSKDIQIRYENPNVDILETFPNKYPENPYIVTFTYPEFTSLCPKTGQPDHATITIEYQPREFCIETKSLKFYLQAYRNHKSFMETNTNKILNDLVHVLDNMHWMCVTAIFTPRGGIQATVKAHYGRIYNGV